MDIETSTLWIMIGTWVAGIGTVGAVITSLYLASNSNKVKLLLQTKIYESLDNGDLYLLITISNVGNKIATIKNINWEISKWGMQKRNLASRTLINSLPVNILEGEEHIIHIDLIENNWLSDITRLTNGYPLKKFKLTVHTIQDTFKTNIDESLINQIMQERENLELSN